MTLALGAGFGQDCRMTLTPADDAFAARLRDTLPADTFRAPEPRYLEEPRGRWAGQCGLLALPRSVE